MKIVQAYSLEEPQKVCNKNEVIIIKNNRFVQRMLFTSFIDQLRAKLRERFCLKFICCVVVIVKKNGTNSRVAL